MSQELPLTKQIPLSQGQFAIVDADDYEALSRFKWHCRNGYAVRNCKRTEVGRASIHMHRVVNKTPPGMEADHINRNRLDNRKCNLRACTLAENLRNKGDYRNNTSGVRHVYFNKAEGRFKAIVRINGKQKCLGTFKAKEAAADAVHNFNLSTK